MQPHQFIKQCRDILDLIGHHMGDTRLALQPAGHPQKPPCDHRAAKPLVDLLPDDDIAYPELILERDEDHAFGRAGTLAHQHKTRHRHPRPFGRQVQHVMGQAHGRAWPSGGMNLWLHENKDRTFICDHKPGNSGWKAAQGHIT